MKVIISILMTIGFANVAMASDPTTCANFAKYGAVRLYRAKYGGNGELDLRAKLVSQTGNSYVYSVILQEAVNDGADDGWQTASYEVTVQADNAEAKHCTVAKVEDTTPIDSTPEEEK